MKEKLHIEITETEEFPHESPIGVGDNPWNFFSPPGRVSLTSLTKRPSIDEWGRQSTVGTLPIFKRHHNALNTNMPIADLMKMQEVALELWGSEFLFCPVNPFARHWIEMGSDTKPFDIKLKTSRWGPFAGLLLANPELLDLTEEEFRQYQEDERACLALPEVAKIPFDLSPEHFYQLQILQEGERPLVTNVERIDEDVHQFVSQNPKGRDITFVGRETEDAIEIFYLDEGKEIRVSVYGNCYPDGSEKFITSDYDKFITAIPLSEWGGSGDKHCLVDLNNHLARLETYRLRLVRLQAALYQATDKELIEKLQREIRSKEHTIQSLEEKIPDEDRRFGNVSGRLMYIRDEINRKLGRIAIHHGDTSHNPYAKKEIDYPLTVVTSRDLFSLKNREELNHYKLDLEKRGYFVPWNERWGEKPGRFNEMKDELARNPNFTDRYPFPGRLRVKIPSDALSDPGFSDSALSLRDTPTSRAWSEPGSDSESERKFSV